MQDIVKYHNDFNKIKLPSFSELEQNLLFGIIARIRDKPAGEVIEISAQELNEFVKERNYTNKELFEVMTSLRKNFFKADFTIIEKEPLGDGKILVKEGVINLFKEFWNHTFIDEFDNFIEYKKAIIVLNPRFEYLVNQITANFTRFELAEFIALSGKYTKTLYRQLKQFRQTGNRLFKWDDFIKIMDIPEDYEMCNIDQRILKPAIKELTAERNLFDTKRIPFKNLKYTKLDKNQQPNPRGRNKVCFIKFEWKRQEPVELEAEITKSMYIQFAEKYKGRTFYFQNFGNFEFLGLGKNEAGEKIFIFQNENGRISTKLEQLPKQHDLDKLAKNIIN